MITDTILAYKIKTQYQEIIIVDSFKYLGEILTFDQNEKRAWNSRINILIRTQDAPKNKYIKKTLSNITTLKHYKSVTQLLTCASETIFQTTNTIAIDKWLGLKEDQQNLINKVIKKMDIEN